MSKINRTNREALQDELKQLTSLAQRLECYGNLSEQVTLNPTQPTALKLEEIIRLQIMMLEKPERVMLTLELGADANSEINDISLLKLAKAYAKNHGETHLVDLLKQYGATEPAVKKHKKPKKY